MNKQTQRDRSATVYAIGTLLLLKAHAIPVCTRYEPRRRGRLETDNQQSKPLRLLLHRERRRAREGSLLRRRVLLDPRASIGGEEAETTVVLDAAPDRATIAEILFRFEQRFGKDRLAVDRPCFERLTDDVPADTV